MKKLFKVVHSEKLGEMAAEFDRVHSVQRALDVGAVDRIIPPANLRSYLITAVERGIEVEVKRQEEEGRAIEKSGEESGEKSGPLEVVAA